MTAKHMRRALDSFILDRNRHFRDVYNGHLKYFHFHPSAGLLKTPTTRSSPGKSRQVSTTGALSIATPREQMSKTQQFRKILPLSSALKRVTDLGVGIPSLTAGSKRRNDRKNGGSALNSVDRIRQPNSKRVGEIPSLFDPKKANPARIFGVSLVEPSPHSDDTQSGVEHSSTFRFPENRRQIPEIAVIGRSNVGKSTLINLLLYRNWSRARVEVAGADNRRRQRQRSFASMPLPKGVKAVASPKPGETKALTFYLLSEKSPPRQAAPPKMRLQTHRDSTPSTREQVQDQTFTPQRLILVDLPGYGFAYAAENLHCRNLIVSYLLDRSLSHLKRILLLVDARHGLKKSDSDFLRQLQDALMSQRKALNPVPPRRSALLPPIQLVLTKCDLVPQTDLARRIVQVRQELAECLDREIVPLPVMMVSARVVASDRGRSGRDCAMGQDRGDGITDLQRQLAEVLPKTEGSGSTRKPLPDPKATREVHIV
jgi:GTP-binding protein EngB required for normal cell division